MGLRITLWLTLYIVLRADPWPAVVL